MASPSKKVKLSTLPQCPYGSKCYRKNPQHLLEFDHATKDKVDGKAASTCLPTTPPSTPSSSTPSLSTPSPPTPSTPTKPSSSTALPTCKYGAKCYRKNLLHFAEFSHTTKISKSDDSGSGNDTDIIDSEEEDKKPVNDILNRGMSLVKNFSQMSEAERKELIKKAFEVKQQLQKELEETKKKVAQKEKKLQALQDQVNTGLLLVDGEKEALEGKKTIYFSLQAERAYKEGSADQIHYRLAESQFYRLLTGSDVRLKRVEYVVNPTLAKTFKEARQNLNSTRGEERSFPVLAFHGTQEKNIIPICETGFKVPGGKGFKQRTDTGWYGKGIYFSEFPEYSMSYIQGATKLLLCQVLPGKVFHCTKLIHGAALKSDHDSHTSPDQKELVIFNTNHILPSYIVHYTTFVGDFKYASGATTSTSGEGAEELFNKAMAAASNKSLKGQVVVFSGSLEGTHAILKALVAKHKGSVGTVATMTILVAGEEEITNETNKVSKARNRGIPIVKQEFIYESILKKKLLDVEKYEHDDVDDE